MNLNGIVAYIAIRVLSFTTVIFFITTLIFLVSTIVLARKVRRNGGADNALNGKGVDAHATSVNPFTFDVVMMQNQGKREYQQDSFYLSDKDNKAQTTEKGLLAVVADGMGGLQDGKAISEITVDAFKNLFNSSPVTEPRKFLTECVYRAETCVDEYMNEHAMKGGSTVISTIIRNNQLHYVSVGDSSIFLARKNSVTRLNNHHNYAAVLQSKVRQGRITQQEADTDPMRSRITSFIGMGDINEVDANPEPIPLQPDDILILCSDGVANALGNDALLNVISSGEFSGLGDRMEETVLSQNIKNQDNFTAVVIKCKEIIN